MYSNSVQKKKIVKNHPSEMGGMISVASLSGGF